MRFDLHIHTNYSDGKSSVLDIMRTCQDNNVKFISVTDHDCVDAYYDKSIYNFPTSLITGVEFSAEWDKNVHILGYGIDVLNKNIIQICERIKQNRMREFMVLIKKLKSIGISVPMEELRKKGKMDINTLAQCMYELGYGESPSEIKKRYLGRESELYVYKKGTNINEIIEAIHDSGGKAILAHPGRYSNDINDLKELIDKLVVLGIDGIEVCSPYNSNTLTMLLFEICKQKNLIYSGGSDFHNKEKEILGMENDEIMKCIRSVFFDI